MTLKLVSTKPKMATPVQESKLWKVAQINLNRCRVAHDLLDAKILKGELDIVLGQEPNLNLLRHCVGDKNGDCFITVDDRIKVVNVIKGSGYVMVKLNDFRLSSCYFSPNNSIEHFKKLLTNMERNIRTSPKGIIIGGDLNAKTQLIGSGECNQRGELFGEWLCSNNLIVVNRGTGPTFIKENRSSLIDFTCASPTTFNRVTNWNVITNKENFSDHQTIAFNILYNNTDLRNTAALKGKRFVYSPTDKNSKKFLESIKNMYAD